MVRNLFWVPGPWSGRLAIMPRPRGNEWLEDEIQSWRRSGVDAVVSLLTADEIADLGLADEAALCDAAEIEFVSFPVSDRNVPTSARALSDLLTELNERLAKGKGIAVHCRQGVGRAALIAICLLVQSGFVPEKAMERVSTARGCPVPETDEQRRWIVAFAASTHRHLDSGIAQDPIQGSIHAKP